MDGCMNLRFIASDHSWWNKSEHWILHSTEWERRRKHKHIVFTPCVWDSNPLFDLIKVILQFRELIFGWVYLPWFCDQVDSVPKRDFLEITNSQRDEIWWNFDGVREWKLRESSFQTLLACWICTHLNLKILWNFDLCFISRLDSRCILQRCHRSTGQSLTLCKQIRHLFP